MLRHVGETCEVANITVPPAPIRLVLQDHSGAHLEKVAVLFSNGEDPGFTIMTVLDFGFISIWKRYLSEPVLLGRSPGCVVQTNLIYGDTIDLQIQTNPREIMPSKSSTLYVLERHETLSAEERQSEKSETPHHKFSVKPEAICDDTPVTVPPALAPSCSVILSTCKTHEFTQAPSRIHPTELTENLRSELVGLLSPLISYLGQHANTVGDVWPSTRCDALGSLRDGVEDVFAKLSDDTVQTYIGVLGATGSGKSSLINCILGEAKILPTSGGGACTFSAVELSYHEADDYIATITFATETEWRSELEELVATLSDEVDVSHTTPITSPTLKLEAAIGGNLVTDVLRKKGSALTVNDLLNLRSGATDFLGKTVQLRSLDAEALSVELARYMMDCGSRSLEGQSWPLVHSVCVRHNWALLSSGVVLVDLPDIQDANSVRGAAMLKYRNQCQAIWIVTDVAQAVDDVDAHTLALEQMQKFLTVESDAFGEVGFVCTKTDNLDVQEILGDFKENMAEACTAAALSEAQFAEVASKLKELDTQLGEITSCDSINTGAAELNRSKERRQLQGHHAQLAKQQRGFCARLRSAWNQGQLRASLGPPIAVLKKTSGRQGHLFSVFTVSSQEMQNLEGRRVSEGQSEVFCNERETGIPGIRAHISRMPDRHFRHRARPLLSHLQLILLDVVNVLQLGNADALRISRGADHMLNRVLTEMFLLVADVPAACVRQLKEDRSSTSKGGDLDSSIGALELQAVLRRSLSCPTTGRGSWEHILRQELLSNQAMCYEEAIQNTLRNAVAEGIAGIVFTPAEGDAPASQNNATDEACTRHSSKLDSTSRSGSQASAMNAPRPTAAQDSITQAAGAACRNVMHKAIIAADICKKSKLELRWAERKAVLQHVHSIQVRYVELCSTLGVSINAPVIPTNEYEALVGPHHSLTCTQKAPADPTGSNEREIQFLPIRPPVLPSPGSEEAAGDSAPDTAPGPAEEPMVDTEAETEPAPEAEAEDAPAMTLPHALPGLRSAQAEGTELGADWLASPTWTPDAAIVASSAFIAKAAACIKDWREPGAQSLKANVVAALNLIASQKACSAQGNAQDGARRALVAVADALACYPGLLQSFSQAYFPAVDEDMSEEWTVGRQRLTRMWKDVLQARGGCGRLTPQKRSIDQVAVGGVARLADYSTIGKRGRAAEAPGDPVSPPRAAGARISSPKLHAVARGNRKIAQVTLVPGGDHSGCRMAVQFIDGVTLWVHTSGIPGVAFCEPPGATQFTCDCSAAIHGLCPCEHFLGLPSALHAISQHLSSTPRCILELNPLDCAFLAGRAADSAAQIALGLAQRQMNGHDGERTSSSSVATGTSTSDMLKSLILSLSPTQENSSRRFSMFQYSIDGGVLQGDFRGANVRLAIGNHIARCSIDGAEAHFFDRRVLEMLMDCTTRPQLVMDSDHIGARVALMTPSQAAQLVLHLCIALDQWEFFRPLLQDATNLINRRSSCASQAADMAPRIITGDWHLDLMGTPCAAFPPRLSPQDIDTLAALFGPCDSELPGRPAIKPVRWTESKYQVAVPLVHMQGCIVARVRDSTPSSPSTNIVTIDTRDDGFKMACSLLSGEGSTCCTEQLCPHVRVVLEVCGTSGSRHHACALSGDQLLWALAELPRDTVRLALVSAAVLHDLAQPIESLLDSRIYPPGDGANSRLPTFSPWVNITEFTADVHTHGPLKVAGALFTRAKAAWDLSAWDLKSAAHQCEHQWWCSRSQPGYESPLGAVSRCCDCCGKFVRSARPRLSPDAVSGAPLLRAAWRLLMPGATFFGSLQTARRLGANVTAELLHCVLQVRRRVSSELCEPHSASSVSTSQAAGHLLHACPMDTVPAAGSEQFQCLGSLKMAAQCTAPLLYGEVLGSPASPSLEPPADFMSLLSEHGAVDGLLHATLHCVRRGAVPPMEGTLPLIEFCNRLAHACPSDPADCTPTPLAVINEVSRVLQECIDAFEDSGQWDAACKVRMRIIGLHAYSSTIPDGLFTGFLRTACRSSHAARHICELSDMLMLPTPSPPNSSISILSPLQRALAPVAEGHMLHAQVYLSTLITALGVDADSLVVHHSGRSGRAAAEAVAALDRLSLAAYDAAMQLLRASAQTCIRSANSPQCHFSRTLVDAAMDRCSTIASSELRPTLLQQLNDMMDLVVELAAMITVSETKSELAQQQIGCAAMQGDVHKVLRRRLQTELDLMLESGDRPDHAIQLLMSHPGVSKLPVACINTTAADLRAAGLHAEADQLLSTAIRTWVPMFSEMDSMAELGAAVGALMGSAAAALPQPSQFGEVVECISAVMTKLAKTMGSRVTQESLHLPKGRAVHELLGLAKHVLDFLPKCRGDAWLTLQIQVFADSVCAALQAIVQHAKQHGDTGEDESIPAAVMASQVEPLVETWGLHTLHVTVCVARLKLALALPTSFTPFHTLDAWKAGFTLAFQAALALPDVKERVVAINEVMACLRVCLQAIGKQGQLDQDALSVFLPALAATAVVQGSRYLYSEISQLQAALDGKVAACNREQESLTNCERSTCHALIQEMLATLSQWDCRIAHHSLDTMMKCTRCRPRLLEVDRALHNLLEVTDAAEMHETLRNASTLLQKAAAHLPLRFHIAAAVGACLDMQELPNSSVVEAPKKPRFSLILQPTVALPCGLEKARRADPHQVCLPAAGSPVPAGSGSSAVPEPGGSRAAPPDFTASTTPSAIHSSSPHALALDPASASTADANVPGAAPAAVFRPAPATASIATAAASEPAAPTGVALAPVRAAGPSVTALEAGPATTYAAAHAPAPADIPVAMLTPAQFSVPTSTYISPPDFIMSEVLTKFTYDRAPHANPESNIVCRPMHSTSISLVSSDDEDC
ncbi:hypothetical protein CYMTET_5122 [Cymbomonas tetramitiformis]|uniref:Dynamin N-terminal domain-containing protein n=1 Tax=Cymbomonas tetramitiformis TaxID=36881 RepID=A0AAE0H000_9CHLO|nr:hypothetical protein CYMTET_5122 [Cymbomonas tetramitiformis]